MRKLINNIFFIIIFFCGINNILSQNNINAKIITKIRDNLVGIKAVAQNNDAIFKDDFNYLLFSLKKGAQGNYSKNSQSGKFSLAPGEEKELSILKVNIQKNEEIKVFLFIRKDGHLVSKDSAKIYSEGKREKKVLNESEFVLKGIVLDEVITKIGKDFHDYFYQAYNSSGNKYPFIIVIKEKPYFGRSSIISVEVDDKKVIQFYSKPDEEYLKSEVKATLINLSFFAKKRKMLFKNSRI